MRHPHTRGERRFRAAVRQAARTWFYRVVSPCGDDAARLGRKFRDLRQPCSCWMCGNARRHSGPTVQELREPPVFAEDLPVVYLSLGPGGLRVTFPGGDQEADDE